MGVELGKVLAKNILAQLNEPGDVKGHDSSVSDLHLLDLGYILKRSTHHIDDRSHPLLPEVQEGIIEYR